MLAKPFGMKPARPMRLRGLDHEKLDLKAGAIRSVCYGYYQYWCDKCNRLLTAAGANSHTCSGSYNSAI